MEDSLFLWLMCGCYFVGGCTIGWWYNERRWRKRSRRQGTGRWDK